jgi:translation elongation factor EF-G
MAQGLNRLHEEDPTFSRHFETSTKETLVYGMGDSPARGRWWTV